MAALYDRVGALVTAVATSGTGAFTLGAGITDATNGDLLSPAQASIPDGTVINYLAQEGSKWEIGTGTYTVSTTSLSRTPVKTWSGSALGTTTPLTFTTAAKVYCVPASSVANTWANAPTVSGLLVSGQSAITFGNNVNTINTPNGGNSNNINVILANGGPSFSFIGSGGGTFAASSNGGIGFTSGSAAFSSVDTVLWRGSAAGTIAQANSTAAQTFQVYGSIDNSTSGIPTANYSRLSLKHAGGTAGATIATEAGGTGTGGPLTVTTSGLAGASPKNFIFGTDGTFTVGSTTGQSALFQAIIPNSTIGLSFKQQNASGSYSFFDFQGSNSQSVFRLNESAQLGFGTPGGTGVDVWLQRNAAGIVEINSGTAGAFRAIKAASFLQAQGTLTSGATVAWDVQAAQSATLTLGVNATLSLATNQVAGTTYCLIVKQDATGSRTLNLSAYKFPGGTQPTLSTAANAVDILTFVSDGTNMYGVAQKAFA